MVDVPHDEISAPWWDATRHGRLVIQRCRNCRRWEHYPRAVCTACGGDGLYFEPVSGRGVVEAFAVVHRQASPLLEPPYTVAQVQLDEGPTLLTNIVDCDPLRCARLTGWS